MSKRYDLIGYCSYRDNETGKVSDNFVGLLNEQDQKIKELEHRLARCIEPKFKIGQEVWWIETIVNGFKERIYMIQSYVIQEITIFKDGIRYMDENGFIYEDDLFATEEEAKAKVREIQNGQRYIVVR